MLALASRSFESMRLTLRTGGVHTRSMLRALFYPPARPSAVLSVSQSPSLCCETVTLIRGTFYIGAGSGPGSHVNLTIINISSIGSAMTTPTFSSYQAGKSAVNRFTEFIHFEYEAEGVRAFSIHPGLSLSSYWRSYTHESRLP
jgi:NAD(P)-dependent dehydrogenase (short-subunit alcohol dehydrogenase family)